MALMPEPPQHYTTKHWTADYFAQALQASLNAQGSWRRPSEGLAHDRQVKNLFLISGRIEDRCAALGILVERASVGEGWGKEDMMVNLMGMEVEMRVEWLKAAACFNGAVYLVGVELSEEEEEVWWKALCISPAPPRALFFLWHFLGRRPVMADTARVAAESLFRALAQNHDIRDLVVYQSDLEFGDHALDTHMSLRSLHLERVMVTVDFLESLTQLDSCCITHRLALHQISHLQRRGRISDDLNFAELRVDLLPLLYIDRGTSYVHWRPSFSAFLQWQLKHLSLVGFRIGYAEDEDLLIDFVNRLRYCALQSLSLGDLLHDIWGDPLARAILDALHDSSLRFLDLGGLENSPAIEAQLVRNQLNFSNRWPLLLPRRAGIRFDRADVSFKSGDGHTVANKLQDKVPALAVRLFICGDAYAGKTTMLSTLAFVCSRRSSIPRFLPGGRSPTVERTQGIEVRAITRGKIQVSVWDMAGQAEFHAFHDHMFPDPSTTHGSPAIFMFVWSPVDSKDEKEGEHKNENAFEVSFRYWLKFITSKTRQSNVLRKLIVVLTRKDQSLGLVPDALQDSIEALSHSFKEVIEVVQVLEVDARSPSSVEPVASCIFEIAQSVLNGVEVYNICDKVSKYLLSKHMLKSQPIIHWAAFSEICKDVFEINDLDVQKAIAFSLNESGDMIYLSKLPFLVLDPNWFCREVMGTLIHFPDKHICRAIIPKDGYVKQEYLEQLLKRSAHSNVEGSILVDLMEAMHLCCKVPNDPDGRVFVPAALSPQPSLNITTQICLPWQGIVQGLSEKFAYVGRRLECDRKDLTFLTPGLFPLLQVVFNKAFCEIGALVKLGRDFMWICVQDIEIIVEFGLAKGEHAIDVMARAPDQGDNGSILAYVEDEIIRTVTRVCAQPEGNQGVKLVKSVIRPDCLKDPAPFCIREDQSVSVQDLREKLTKQLQEGRRPEKLLYLWNGNEHLGPVASRFIDLLGSKEYLDVLLSYMNSLKDASMISYRADLQGAHDGGGLLQGHAEAGSTSGVNHETGQGMEHGREDACLEGSHTMTGVNEVSNVVSLHTELSTDGKEQPIVLTFSKGMAQAIFQQLHKIDAKLDGLESMNEGIHAKLDALHKDTENLRSGTDGAPGYSHPNTSSDEPTKKVSCSHCAAR